MSSFTVFDEKEVKRCYEAHANGKPIAISAVVNGKVQHFRGVVQSISKEQRGSKNPETRWLITMLDDAGSRDASLFAHCSK